MTEEEWTRVSASLSEKADELLRSKLRRKGDIGERFRKAISGTDWDTLEILKRRKTLQAWRVTGFTIQRRVYDKLRLAANKRGVEISALLDAIIISYYSQPDAKST